MNAFFLVIEFSIFIYAAYVFIYKKELAVIHLPVLFFAQATITPTLPAVLNYLLITVFILFLISKNLLFFRKNLFAIFLCLLFLFLVPNSDDLVTLRPFIFAVIWLFLLIPLIGSIYTKYPGRVVFQELTSAAFIILCVFILNVVFSSLTGYAPYAMYGITTGVLYGNLYATDFNILPIALFIVLLKIMSKKNLLYFVVFMLSFSFIMLSFRRSVMGLSLLGIGIALLIFLTPENFKSIAAFIIVFPLIAALIVVNTSFLELFNERYALRKLDNRELNEEKRFQEYELIYKDMFVYQDYSPWLGYALYDSDGNYGKGVLGRRTLHGDLTSIAHSSGLLGLALYLLMIFTVFRLAYSKASSRTDNFILLFCALVFMVYTITGRYTNIGSFVLLMLLLMLPLTIKKPKRKSAIAPPQAINKMTPQL